MNYVNVGNDKLEMKKGDKTDVSLSKDKFNNKYLNMQNSMQSPLLQSHSGSPNTADRKLIYNSDKQNPGFVVEELRFKKLDSSTNCQNHNENKFTFKED